MTSNVNNIFGIRINTIMNNGSLNFGNIAHTSHQVKMEVNAGYLQAGDAINSPMSFDNTNYMGEYKVVDQGQKQV